MKDSQHRYGGTARLRKYIKANNERFSTSSVMGNWAKLSISRRIMKDSQRCGSLGWMRSKYIKANNERFSTTGDSLGCTG